MEDVVKAIENLAKKDMVDYLLVIVPIFISIVAIFISIATASKQNKIALFERRYACLFQIKTVLAFSGTIECTFSKEIIIRLFDSFWGTNIAQQSKDDQLISILCQLETIKRDVEQATFLFKYKLCTSPKDIISKFKSVLLDVVLDKPFDSSRNEFIAICKEFELKDLKRIETHVKL